MEKKVGSRAEVFHGKAEKTTGGLTKNDLIKNKYGYIVSKIKSRSMKNHKKSDNLSKRDKEVMDIFNSFHNANKHKMDPIPVCKIPKDYI